MSAPLEIGRDGGFYSLPDADVLVVLLHAFDSGPATMQRVGEIVREEFPHSDLYAPRLPVGMFSANDPERIAASILDFISGLERIASYQHIVFVGHSLGAVLARKVWAFAHGATPEGTVEPARILPWSDRIDRIVLLAALNRGWRVSSALSPVDRLIWASGSALGHVYRHILGLEPTIFAFRRGAPFLTTTRLQCLAVTRAKGDAQPIIVQLLGTADDYVAPTDNLDLATGGDFFYLEVPEAPHYYIVDLDRTRKNANTAVAAAAFRLALTGDRVRLKEDSLNRADVFDLFDESIDDHDVDAPRLANPDVTDVVFVVHGIRDKGFWTRRIAREVKAAAHRAGRLCRAITSTYGYFPMGPFILPWLRRDKVEWLLDQYVTAKSIYPNATFSYIGHSNGTYLLTRALQLCPAVRFERVVFGGSVVRTGFAWTDVMPVRVRAVLNYVATGDWVVAIFPHGLERMRLQDLGGAGHLGFADAGVRNLCYVDGGHSAALVSARWKEMADFVVNGIEPTAPSPQPARKRWVLRAGNWAPFIWLLLAVAVLFVGCWLLFTSLLGGAAKAVLFSLYLATVWIVLTRA